jgi:protein SCO1/2
MKRLLIVALLMLAGSAFADSTFPSSSIYQLSAKLTNQTGVDHGLDVYKGHPVLVTMFYGSCGHTCPLLIETLRAVERAAPDTKNLRVLMISIDPDRDTVAALAKIAKERRIDTSRWTLARADANTVRKIAAVLDIQYKESADGEFNHSSVISVLSTEGTVLQRSSTLGKADRALLDALRTAM